MLSPVSASTTPSSSTSTSFLECPICQQSLLLEHLQQGQPTSQEAEDNLSSSSASATDATHATDNRPDDWCPVCTPCGHMFHRACISEWFRTRQQYEGESSSQNRCYCPSCRKIITYHKLVRVYLPITPAYDDDGDNMSVSIRPAASSSSISVSEYVRRYSEQQYNMTMNRGYGSSGSRIYNDLFAFSSRRFSQDLGQTAHGSDADSTYRRYNPYHHHGHLRNRQTVGHNQDNRHTNMNSAATTPTNGSGSEAITNTYNCENADCVALKNVLDLLSRELTWTQRKLEVEVDISRMKSILVRGLQKDVDLLKKIKRNGAPPAATRIVWILLISFFFFWITACFCAVLF